MPTCLSSFSADFLGSEDIGIPLAENCSPNPGNGSGTGIGIGPPGWPESAAMSSGGMGGKCGGGPGSRPANSGPIMRASTSRIQQQCSFYRKDSRSLAYLNVLPG